MERKASVEQSIRFAEFEVDPRAGELRKLGVKVKLQEQPFQVLAILLEHPGEVVTREELRQRIWPADTFVDFENGLNKAINKLRGALGDSAENPRFVETLPRHGYRFIASTDRVVEQERGHLAKGGHVGVPPQSRRWLAAIGGAAILGSLIFGLNMAGLHERLFEKTGARPIQSLAVLPLVNLSGDPSQEYFADGMTEALITDLGKIGNLRVISRTSTMQYKGARKKTVPAIARELNVDAVVEGAVLQSGNRVRISAQLIQVTPEKHLWADSYERDLQDILAVQNDIARAVTAQVNIALTPQQQQRRRSVHSVNPDVYRAYLKARYLLNNERSEEGARKAVEYSLLATRLDPNSALAFAVLADSYTSLNYLGGAMPHEAMPKARAAAERALALADLGAAHVALADILLSYAWDWSGAEREVKRALELNHSDSGAHNEYAWYLSIMGRTDEAVAEAKSARELDPLSMVSNRDVGRMLYLARRYDEALVELQHTAELFPNSKVLFNWLGDVYLAKGMPGKAVEMDLKNRTNRGASPETLAALRRAFETSGMRGYWKKELQLAPVHRRGIICAYANIALGKYDEAFECMAKSYRERVVWITNIKTDPHLDPIRSDPRFQDLLRRMGLPP